MLSRVSPFRHPRIIAHLQLPKAFRSLSRLSSAPGAKASVLRPFWLDLLAYTLAYVYAAFSFFSWFSCIPSLKGMLSAHRFFFPFDLWFRSVFGFQGSLFLYNNPGLPGYYHAFFGKNACIFSRRRILAALPLLPLQNPGASFIIISRCHSLRTSCFALVLCRTIASSQDAFAS